MNNSLKKILNYTKKYWTYLLISGATASLYGLASGAPTYVIKFAVDEVFVKKINSLLIPFILCFLLLFALKGLFMYLSNYYMNFVGNKVINDIRQDLFNKVIYFPISFFQKNTTGQLMSHFLNDIQMIQNASSSSIKNGVRSFFEAIVLLGVAFTQNWKLSLLMLIVGPAIGICIKKMGKSIKSASINIQKSMGNISSSLQEVFIGIREVKAFNGEKIEINRLNKNLSECFSSIMRNVHIESLAPAFIETIAMFGSSAVFYVAAQQIMAGTSSPGQITAFFAAILLAYQPLKRLINVYSEIQYALAAGDRVFDLMEKVYPATLHKQNNLIIKDKFNLIKFDNLFFSYNTNTPVLQNINLEINKGEKIGLIGPSGSGKSTLCDLLLGFITPSSGKILINNHNITQIPLKNLRDQIGYVGQKTFLFNDTILANISYSQQNKTEQDIINACKAAHADEFIQKMPLQYQTIVGENGNILSGGQKQRITIARALLKDPQILIFDEATSSLDHESEEMIRLTLQEIGKDKTIIIISHRLSFIENMDKIFLLQNKQLKEIDKKTIFNKNLYNDYGELSNENKFDKIL
ncbi:ABC transporter ATP-binding protein/permease [Candidatus Babeliales bacterium]|nr:ABC transporter ATP-binding protein/permease [Candidatus Babeliales bacterium]MCF7899676.1 ABC transporter ATP-binding protein/permease [Candidatus Babeliales bacterium]